MLQPLGFESTFSIINKPEGGKRAMNLLPVMSSNGIVKVVVSDGCLMFCYSQLEVVSAQHTEGHKGISVYRWHVWIDNL